MEYQNHQPSFEVINSFSRKLEDLVREIVIQNDIPCYRIESSVKHNSAGNAEDAYIPLIRIITYFEDTVNKISHILHDEFDVDVEIPVDKKKIRIETFAYKNINYKARLKPDRQKQTEYRRSGNKKFEIYICSMLQDAWAGIEKELGFDSSGIPDEDKRDLYRVGALLEMADIEFMKIRAELSKKMLNRVDSLPGSMHTITPPTDIIVPKPVAEATDHGTKSSRRENTVSAPHYNGSATHTATSNNTADDVQLSDAVLRAYVDSSQLIKETDMKIADQTGAKISSDTDIEGDVERLAFLNIHTLKQLNEVVSHHRNEIVAFADKWIGKNNGGSFDAGISLFYLEYLLVGIRNDPAFAIEYVTKFISDNDYSARYIIPTYHSIRNGTTPDFQQATLKR